MCTSRVHARYEAEFRRDSQENARRSNPQGSDPFTRGLQFSARSFHYNGFRFSISNHRVFHIILRICNLSEIMRLDWFACASGTIGRLYCTTQGHHKTSPRMTQAKNSIERAIDARQEEREFTESSERETGFDLCLTVICRLFAQIKWRTKCDSSDNFDNQSIKQEETRHPEQ